MKSHQVTTIWKQNFYGNIHIHTFIYAYIHVEIDKIAMLTWVEENGQELCLQLISVCDLL